MTEFVISIANMRIKICAIYPFAKEFCKNYIDEGEPDFTVVITEDCIDFEREKSAKEDVAEGRSIREFSPDYLETLAIYRKIVEKMLDYDAFLFHGSALSVDGEGYLFTAKSGTGKSTHTRRWRYLFKERCVVVNDDKPLLMVKEDCIMICGTPWDGKHRRSANVMVPLKNLIILERGDVNEINPISVVDALPLLLQQCYRPGDPIALVKTLKLLEQMTNKVSLYRLRCNTLLEAAKIAYAGMNRKDN